MENIIFTQRVEVVENYHERRDCADQRIAGFIYACGFLPVPVPNEQRFAWELIQNIKPAGIVLTGGNSMVKYGGNAPERDAMDEELIRIALQEQIPLYGFCRGMQSILSYFGNQLETVYNHVAVRHNVQDGVQCYEVNSYHNQACKQLKKDCGLIVTARAEDGVIEAVQHEKFPIMGTMWHPERESCFTQRDMKRIINLFHI